MRERHIGIDRVVADLAQIRHIGKTSAVIEEEGVTIGGGPGAGFVTDHRAGTGLVVKDDGLAENLLESARDDARP